MYYLLKFGYDGRCFTGYQRGNGHRSVEDSILEAMGKYGISDSFSSAARTDRGVSAAGNVIFFKSGMEIGKITGILNSQVRGMIFHSYAEVDRSFRVRFSSMKHYRYFLNSRGIDAARFRRTMGMFSGTHDFSLFSRKDSRSPVRTVESVSVIERDGFLEVNIFGPNFVWNQIRYMVGFARFYSAGSEEVPYPFDLQHRKWPLAASDPLILMNIDYKDLDFKRSINKKKVGLWGRQLMDLRLHAAVLDSIINIAYE